MSAQSGNVYLKCLLVMETFVSLPGSSVLACSSWQQINKYFLRIMYLVLASVINSADFRPLRLVTNYSSRYYREVHLSWKKGNVSSSDSESPQ